MRTAENLIGQVFTRLTVIARAEDPPDRAKKVRWLCQCECGAQVSVQQQKLRIGASRSCGCLNRETRHNKHRIHGHTAFVDGKRAMTLEFRTWLQMRKRFKHNPDYTKRGMCEEWQVSFVSFYEYLMSSIGAHPGKGYTIDRIENENGYFPGNIRWATAKQQANNRRKRRV